MGGSKDDGNRTEREVRKRRKEEGKREKGVEGKERGRGERKKGGDGRNGSYRGATNRRKTQI